MGSHGGHPLHGGLQSQSLKFLSQPPRVRLRFVDDTFVVHKAVHIQQCLSHLNSLDPHTQLTTKSQDLHGSCLFLDTLVSQAPNGTLITTVYRSPHIQINTYIGTVITASPTDTALTTHSHTGPDIFDPTNSYWNKKSNTSILHLSDMISLTGFSTSPKQKWTTNSANNNDTITSILTGTQIKTATFLQWCHIPKDSVKL